MRSIALRVVLFGALTAFAIQWASAAPTSLDIKSYGAKGDGVTDDGPAIQAAIAACPQGGTVLVSKGRYLVKTKPLELHSDMTLQGVGTDSAILKGSGLKVVISATKAPQITIDNLKVGVDGTTSPKLETRLILFVQCTDVKLTNSILDGTDAKGLPSTFSLCQFACCNGVKCLNNHFINAAGSATGVTGASWVPDWGHDSEFAGNTIDDYCDTGIGIWTGARKAYIHDNHLRGRAERFTSFPVGIDVDGGTQSTIENNDIAGGQIAIRIYDTHDGTYPMTGLMIRGNYLHDQLNYDAAHPAWAVKPENPKSTIEATFEKNRIVESAPNAYGFMGGGAGKTTLHLDDNTFSGGTFWVFGGYKAGSLEIISGGKDVDWKSASGTNSVSGRLSG